MVNKKNMLMMFVVLVFSSVSVFSTDIIDMRSDVTIIENSYQNIELQLFKNYLQVFNNEDLVKQISPYYKNIVITIDNYSMTISFNDNGITKIVEGYNKNDLHIKLTRIDINYLINNWFKITTFEKIKYLINLDIPISDMLRLSGIAMSIK